MSSQQILDMQTLLSAQMDDIDDLPPVGVPPTGHYNLEVTCTLEQNKEKTGQYFKWAYEVKAINEVKNEAEVGEVSVGTQFSDRISPFKKDGTPNDFGMGKLKEMVVPYATHFGVSNMGEAIQLINKVDITAELKRRPDRNDPERHNFNLDNVVVL